MTDLMILPVSQDHDRRSSASARYSFAAEESPDQIAVRRRQETKLASRIISVAALGIWLGLMVAMVLGKGDLLTIALATLIPFLAHVANVSLTARAETRDAGARTEPGSDHA